MNILILLRTFKEMERLARTKSDKDKNKMPPAVRTSLEAREAANANVAKVKLDALIENIRKEYNTQGVDYLKQALAGFGLSGLLDDSPALDAKEYSEALNYRDIYDHTIYNNLLPLCKLAYFDEQNGIAEEHAFKLATIFTTEQRAIDYVLDYAKYKPNYLLHDACLFQLPPAKGCNLTHWKKRANQSQQGISREPAMFSRRFRDLLPHAPAIERLIKAGQRHDIKLDKKAINDKKKELAKSVKNYKIRFSKPEPRPTEEQKAQRRAELNALNQERLQLKLDLATLCSGISLQAADNIIFDAFYAEYQASSSAAHQVLINHGISEKNIAVFYGLSRDNDDNAIPDVTINGKDIDHPGYYLTKLDTLNDKGAAIAACLGKITPCCQHLGGLGHDCAVHGITSKNGGFYLLQQGDANNPSLDDKIIASSWAWRGKSEGMCFDSIETSSGANISLIADMFRYFGHQLCHNPDFQKYNLSRVTTGASSGVTGKVGLDKYYPPAEQPKDYQGYRDSKLQFLLANSAIPYLFVGNTTLGKYIKNETNEFFSRLLSRDTSLTKNEPLKQAIDLTLQTENPQLLDLMKEMAGNFGKIHELEALIKVNRQHLENISQLKPDLKLLSLVEQGAYLFTANKEGRTALHLVAHNPESLKIILGLLPENERLGAVKLIYNYGWTVLHEAAPHPESLKIILDLYPENERLEAVKISGKYGWTVLHEAVTHPESLKIVLDLYPENKRLETIKLTGVYGETILHHATTHPESLKTILDLYLENERLDAVKLADKNGKTALHYAATYPESLKIVLDLYPENKRLETVKLTGVYGETILHHAATHPQSLKIILDLYPENEKLEAVKLADKDGETALHKAATHPESLKIILESLPENERLEAVKLADKDGKTVLHKAATHPESFKIILDLLPKNERLEAVKLAVALHKVATQPKALKIILESLPKNERLEAVKLTDTIGWNVLHKAATQSESLKIILELYPENERLEAVKLTGRYDKKTAFHIATGEPESLKIILELLPENERLEAVNHGRAVLLRHAKDHPELFKITLDLLTEDQRINFLQTITQKFYMRELIRPDLISKLQDSFAIDYLKILMIIPLQAFQRKVYSKFPISNSVFSVSTQKNGGGINHDFEQAILNAQSFDDVKVKVYTFLSTHGDCNLAKQLKKELYIEGNREDTLKGLRERWDLPETDTTSKIGINTIQSKF